MKSNDHTSVEISEAKPCDFSDGDHGSAVVDGKTVFGPWANMCAPCFDNFGVGLGLGKGQRLVLIEHPTLKAVD